MLRRFAYACAGGLLSAGAPVGLLGLRLARCKSGSRLLWLRLAARELAADRAGYMYVGTSTALAFVAFGYIIGRQADRLARLSETDALTGLCNGRGLLHRLATELARSRRYGHPLSLLLMDLDGLKSVNDRYGHLAGDEAIRGLAAVIRSELRETDIGARWGGDEFAVLAPSTSESAALALADRIRDLIPQRNVLRPLTGSVGVVTVDPRVNDELVEPLDLMRAADTALYEAKRRGRNRVVTAPAAVLLMPRPEHGGQSESAAGSHRPRRFWRRR